MGNACKILISVMTFLAFRTRRDDVAGPKARKKSHGERNLCGIWQRRDATCVSTGFPLVG